MLPHRAGLCLDILIARAPEPVTREALLEAVWDGSIVDDSNLSHAMLALRKALGPAPDGSSYIETVPRLGYRLVPPIRLEEAPTRPDDILLSPAVLTAESPRGPADDFRANWSRRWMAMAAIAIVTITGIFAGGAVLARRGARVEAASHVQSGFRLLRRSNAEDLAAATKEFDEALVLQPGLPIAMAGLAEASARIGQDSFSMAIELARSAVEADAACTDCRGILAYILMTRAWNWAESRRLLDEVIRERPGDAQTYIWSSLWLAVNGRLPEATAEAERAVRLDPANAGGHAQLASVHYLAGRYPEALAASSHASQLNPRLQVAHHWRMRTLMVAGPASDVAVARAEEMAAWGNYSHEKKVAQMAQFSGLFFEGGANRLADFWLNEVSQGRPRAVNQYERATWQMWAGRPAAALDELEAALAGRPYRVIYTAADPIFRPLRRDPRFVKIVGGLGLPSPPPS
jgi:tetratricopeptide (TPR) repeat protein